MSVFANEGIDRLSSFDVANRKGKSLDGRGISHEMAKDESGRVVVVADSDVFPAAQQLARDRLDGDEKVYQKVAAFFLSTICGWTEREVCRGIGLSGHEAAGCAIRAGAKLMREGTVRL